MPPVASSNVLNQTIVDREQMRRCYIDVFRNGGLFVPRASVKSMRLGAPVFLIVHLPGSTKAHAVNGKIAFLRPVAAADRPVGCGVHFDDGEAGVELRAIIEQELTGLLASDKPTYTV